MRFLLLFLPLFTYGQTFTVLVENGDSMFVAPLDTMRYALSLREAADSMIVVKRSVILKQVEAAKELHNAIANLRISKDKSDTAYVELRTENIRLTDQRDRAERKSDRRGKALWIAIPIAIISTALHFTR